MRKWVLPITIVCIISGLLLSLQFKAQASLSSNPIGQRNKALVELIQNLEQEIVKYQNELTSLREELENIENNKASGQEDIQKLQQKVQKAKLKAGLLSVKGRGIKIILDDNKAGLNANPNDDPNRYIIHYENILNIITELKLGRAEAISINGQRIVTPSEIRCVGNVILVNTTRLAPPFEISAIGNPDFLEEVLISGEYDLLKGAGFPVSYTKYTKENPLEIPAYTGTFQFNYVKINE
ncbi:MAG: hypothetical protein PWQ67_2082 [Clostridia bacterium]|nr:hypothetical protein [Clostridia bacterium]MDN5323628.1 hypothetical protein [Clostridia bacterium]